jgi:hypothetical protein
MKFFTYRHSIYLIARADENKKVQSYYKLTEEELEEITKDWLADLLIPANPVEMYDPDIPETTQK